MRRLVITVTASGFLAESEVQNRLGYWTCLSRTICDAFPFYIVARYINGSVLVKGGL